MRVCQFRHYGTVFNEALSWKADRINRDTLVLQTLRGMSIRWSGGGERSGWCRTEAA
jgi:hypothetical protein